MFQIDLRGEEESTRRGSREAWPLFEEYIIQDGVLLPKSWHPDHLNPKDGRRFYFPLGRPEIVTEFQKITAEDERELLQFVHSYGFLGYWRYLDPIPDADKPWLSGEPLEWIWWHHRTIRMVFDLLEGVRSGSDEALKKAFMKYGAISEEERKMSFRFQFAVRNMVLDRGRDSEASDPEGIETPAEFLAKWLVTDVINLNTTSIHRQLLHFPGYPLYTSVSYVALIEVMYWHLMEIVDRGREIRRCKYCNNFFLKTNARQEFCPPPSYSVAQKKVSLCGAKYHNRNQQRKK